MKKIVVPGELVAAERKKAGEHVFQREGKLYSDSLGFVNEHDGQVTVVPLEGKYVPRRMDVVIGIVTDEKAVGYLVDINSFTQSFVLKKEVRDQLRPGSIISAKVMDVNELKEADLSQVRVFYGGDIIAISPVKIPRVIGKNCSMLDVLKRGTNANLVVGRNGWIWAKGGNMPLLAKAIAKISEEAHVENLTKKMQEMISIENKSVKPPASAPNPKEEAGSGAGGGDMMDRQPMPGMQGFEANDGKVNE